MSDVFEREEKNWKKTEVSEQGEFQELPAGDYQMVIQEVSAGKAKTSGREQITWGMKVCSGAKYGRKHFFRTPLEGEYLYITKNTVWACGLHPETMGEFKKLIQAEAFNGLVVEVKITDKGQTFVNKVVGTDVEEEPTKEKRDVPAAKEIEPKEEKSTKQDSKSKESPPTSDDEEVPWD